jgi:hypothetical protein
VCPGGFLWLAQWRRGHLPFPSSLSVAFLGLPRLGEDCMIFPLRFVRLGGPLTLCLHQGLNKWIATFCASLDRCPTSAHPISLTLQLRTLAARCSITSAAGDCVQEEPEFQRKPTILALFQAVGGGEEKYKHRITSQCSRCCARGVPIQSCPGRGTSVSPTGGRPGLGDGGKNLV